MTAWQRQTTGIAGAAAPGPVVGPERSPRFCWEDWFLHASAPQRAEALSLAQQQGVLYANQIPRPGNGVKANATTSPSGVAPLLARILAGKLEPQAPFELPCLPFFDTELDEVQQQAVLRAVGTPDVFLLQGLPGSGKSRVLAEIILQTAAAGGRVLLLASQSSSLDVILQRLIGRPEVFPLRLLEASEKLDALPDFVRGLTLENQRRSLVESVLSSARASQAAIDARCKVRSEEESIWTELHSVLGQGIELDRRIAGLRERTPTLASEFEKSASDPEAATPFAEECASRARALEATLAEMERQVTAQRTTVQKSREDAQRLSQRIAEWTPAYEAKKAGRFWLPVCWPHLFNSQILRDMESTQAEHAEAERRQQAAAAAITDLETQRRLATERHASDHAAALQLEIQTRLAEHARELDALAEQRQSLEACWRSRCDRLMHAPTTQTAGAIESARERWLADKASDLERCQFAHQWTRFIEEAGGQLTTRLPQLANLLAATVSTWQADPLGKEATAHAPGSGTNGSHAKLDVEAFDLLIVEDADRWTEADLLRSARQARRCVLTAGRLEAPVPIKGMDKPARAFSAMPVAPIACWPRLHAALACDASSGSASWLREEGRLICQLVPITKEDRQHLDSEPLTDAAEIELRILHRPKAQPCLAQMAFPAHWTFSEALAFVVREAQELPIGPLGKTAWWREDAHWLSWNVAPSWIRVHSWLDIEPGVRVGITGPTLPSSGDASMDEHTTTRMVRIEFDKSARWDRSRAEGWIARHLLKPDSGRAVFLQIPYRFAPGLAKTVAGFFPCGEWLLAGDGDDNPAVEFTAVPPCKTPGAPKEAAGLELDLSATRHLDRLPSDLRSGLPARGFVNYLEAQALIRRLEALAQAGFAGLESPPRIAVLAFYESQLELLRRLIAKSELLSSLGIRVEMSLPGALHQREFDLVFLSLTRSHAHRCGAFANDLRELSLALTRACRGLFIFGDLGMLARRSQWTAPVDHLDANASLQEAQHLSRLLALALRTQPKSVPSNGTGHAK